MFTSIDYLNKYFLNKMKANAKAYIRQETGQRARNGSLRQSHGNQPLRGPLLWVEQWTNRVLSSRAKFINLGLKTGRFKSRGKRGEKRKETGRNTRYQSRLVKLKRKLSKSGKKHEPWPLDAQSWAIIRWFLPSAEILSSLEIRARGQN